MEIRESSGLSIKLSSIQKNTEEQPPVAQLDSTVQNNSAAAKDISSFSSPEEATRTLVAQAVSEATGAQIRDVDRAADLAQKIKSEVPNNPGTSLAAQAQKQNPDVVKALLQ